MRIFADTDIVAAQTDTSAIVTALALGSDYTVAVNADQRDNPGGTLNMLTALPVGYSLDLTTALEATQGARLTNAGGFYPEVVENALDKLTILQQQAGVNQGQYMRAPFPETIDELPSAPDRALRIPAFDAVGQLTMLVGVDSGSAAALALDLLSTAAAKGAGQVAFSHATDYGVGTTGLALQRVINVKNAPYNAAGDGTADDTAAIQAAIDAAQTAVGAEVYFPPRDPGQYYKITAPLRVTAPVRIRGAGAQAVQIIAPAGTLTAGQYILDIDCLAGDNVEYISVQGLTLRSLDGVPSAMRLKNSAYTNVTDVRFWGTAYGMDVDGTRCFSNVFTNVAGYSITSSTVRFLSTFAGGGQYTFNCCTFSGDIGLYIPAGALTDSITMVNPNFEQCVTRALRVNGTLQGMTMVGARGEAGTGHGMEFAPTSSHEVTGLFIGGMSYYNGTVAARPITLGTAAGTGGRVRGFAIVGNRVGYAGLDYFCVMHPEAQSGLIAGNHFAETTTAVVDGARAGVVVFGNENASGRLPEYWGTADWGVEQGTWTPADGSGAGLTFSAASGRYTKIGRLVQWQAFITYPVTANGSNAEVAGLPYVVGGLTGNAEGRAGARVDITNLGSAVGILQGVTGSQEFAFYGPTSGSAITNATLSGKYMYCSGSYMI